MPVIPLPPGFSWGFVVARSIHAMADTTRDNDRFPEARGSNGRVNFTPHLRFKPHTSNPTAFVNYENVSARMVDGTLIDAEEKEGIYLIEGYYTVSFNLEGASIPSFDIEVTSNHTRSNPLDLVTAVPVVIPPGYVEVVRISDRVRAEEAAQRAENTAQHFANTAAQTAQQAAEAATADARGYSEAAAGSATDAANTAQAMDAILDDFVTDGIPLATETTPGLMSAPDKTKLDGVSDGAINEQEVGQLLPNLSGFASEDYVNGQIDALSIPSIQGLASEQYVQDSVQGLASTEDLNSRLQHYIFVSGRNLFDIQEPGVYYQNQNAIATAEDDYPEPGRAGTLQVYSASNTIVTQTWTSHISGRIFTRSISSGTYRSWREQAQVSDIPDISGLASKSDVISEIDSRGLATTQDLPDISWQNSGRRVDFDGTPIYYDSGWRNISSSMNSFMQGELHVRRTLNQIHYRFINVSSTNASSETTQIISSLSSNWRPQFRHVFELPSTTSSVVGTILTYVTGGILNISGEVDFRTRETTTPYGDRPFSGDVSFMIDSPPPTTLIGTPV